MTYLQQQFHLKNIALVTTHPVITIPDYISSSTTEVTQSGDPSERHRLHRVTRKNPQLHVLNKTEIPVFRFTVSGIIVSCFSPVISWLCFLPLNLRWPVTDVVPGKMKMVSISGINLTPQGTFLSTTMTRFWEGMERAVRPEILETTKVPRKTKAPALNALTRSLLIYPSSSRNRSRSLLKISKWRLSSINKKSCSSHSISVLPHSAN